MTIQEILRTKENVLLVVSIGDLKELFNSLLDEREAERKSVSDNQRGKELITAEETAELLGVSRKALSEFINEKSSLSPDMALRISIATGTSAESWMKMQSKWL